jgi:hypothetical protein
VTDHTPEAQPQWSLFVITRDNALSASGTDLPSLAMCNQTWDIYHQKDFIALEISNTNMWFGGGSSTCLYGGIQQLGAVISELLLSLLSPSLY